MVEREDRLLPQPHGFEGLVRIAIGPLRQALRSPGQHVSGPSVEGHSACPGPSGRADDGDYLVVADHAEVHHFLMPVLPNRVHLPRPLPQAIDASVGPRPFGSGKYKLNSTSGPTSSATASNSRAFNAARRASKPSRVNSTFSCDIARPVSRRRCEAGKGLRSTGLVSAGGRSLNPRLGVP